MTSSSNDDISKAFQDVEPDDITDPGEHFFEHTPGPETFQQFLHRHLYSIRYAFVAADGVINPVSALSDTRTERLFAARDDETLQEMLQRVTEMARATGSTRFFFSRLVPITMTTLDAPQLDETDPSWAAALLWFAEDKATNTRQQGSIHVADGAALGEIVTAPRLGGLIADWLHGVLA